MSDTGIACREVLLIPVFVYKAETTLNPPMSDFGNWGRFFVPPLVRDMDYKLGWGVIARRLLQKQSPPSIPLPPLNV